MQNTFTTHSKKEPESHANTVTESFFPVYLCNSIFESVNDVIPRSETPKSVLLDHQHDDLKSPTHIKDQKGKRKKKINENSNDNNSKKTKEIIAKKVLKPACDDKCRLQCKEAINDEARRRINEEFWNLQQECVDKKWEYIAALVQQLPVKRRRGRSNAREGKRQLTHKYFLGVDGKKITVCKKFFLNTLNVCPKTVEIAVGKKINDNSIFTDKRGRRLNPGNKISEEVRNNIRNHISRFPAYEFYYSREGTNKRYLGSHLSIKKMYNLYLEDCAEKKVSQENIGKEWLYFDIFNKEFNFAFKPPDSTCDICDKIKIQLQKVDTEENRSILQNQYDQHLEDASNRYKLKSEDRNRSKENQFEKVIMIDLEEMLPTPELPDSQNSSLTFWTYNLGICDLTADKSYCMMWDESIAGRGANEMASCLSKWVEISEIPDTITELCFWSDSWSSQNRNILMIMCYHWILKMKPHIKVINHKFLARGHTHLEDAVHSIMERERKKFPEFQIYSPWDWQQLARICALTVYSMEAKDFFNFKNLCYGLSSAFVARNQNNIEDEFLKSQVVQFQLKRESPEVVFYKTDFIEDFKQLNLNRRVALPNQLERIKGTRSISTRKYNHLKTLLKWVPKIFHSFYINLAYVDNYYGDDREESNMNFSGFNINSGVNIDSEVHRGSVTNMSPVLNISQTGNINPTTNIGPYTYL